MKSLFRATIILWCCCSTGAVSDLLGEQPQATERSSTALSYSHLPADSQTNPALAKRIVELEQQVSETQAQVLQMERQLDQLTRPSRPPSRPATEPTVRLAGSIVAGELPSHESTAESPDTMTAAIDRDIDESSSHAGGQAAPASLWDRLERDLDIFGQMRVRQETDFERITGPTRNRQRLRLRFGADYQMNPELKIGGRLTTGDRKSSLEPVDRGGAPVSYQDTGDVFDKFEINIDRLFATFTPECLPGTWLSVGKFKNPIQLNPIFDSPVGDLLWDEAAQPEGVAIGYSLPSCFGFDRVRVVLGESAVLELSNLDDTGLLFGQLWAEKQLGCSWRLSSGIAFYDWNNLNPDGNTTLSAENNSGNAVIVVGPDPLKDVIFASEFRILNPLVVLTYDDGDPCSGLELLQLVGEVFQNTGSFDNDRDFGYSVGAAYGPAIRSQDRGAWYAYYAWAEVQQESVFTPVAQDDFQQATNFRGHMFGLAWYLYKSTELRLSFLVDTPIEPIGVSEETEWRGRLDLTVGF